MVTERVSPGRNGEITIDAAPGTGEIPDRASALEGPGVVVTVQCTGKLRQVRSMKGMRASQGGSSYAVGVGLATVRLCIEDEALEVAHKVDLHFVARPHP